jgi:hypothetical protein
MHLVFVDLSLARGNDGGGGGVEQEQYERMIRLGKITKSKWPNYKANYKISLYRDPVRRNSTKSNGGKPLSRQKLGHSGGCIPAITVTHDY